MPFTLKQIDEVVTIDKLKDERMLSNFIMALGPGDILTAIDNKRILQLNYQEVITLLSSIKSTKPLKLKFYIAPFVEKNVKLRYMGPDTNEEDAFDENNWRHGTLRVENQQLR